MAFTFERSVGGLPLPPSIMGSDPMEMLSRGRYRMIANFQDMGIEFWFCWFCFIVCKTIHHSRALAGQDKHEDALQCFDAAALMLETQCRYSRDTPPSTPPPPSANAPNIFHELAEALVGKGIALGRLGRNVWWHRLSTKTIHLTIFALSGPWQQQLHWKPLLSTIRWCFWPYAKSVVYLPVPIRSQSRSSNTE